MAVSSDVQTMGWTRRDFAATFQRIVRERYIEVGERIRELREAKGYSQEALASEAGISSKTMSRIESPPKSGHHETRGATYRKLAAVLGVSVEFLREPLTRGATIKINPQAPPADLAGDDAEAERLRREGRRDEGQDQPGEQHG